MSTLAGMLVLLLTPMACIAQGRLLWLLWLLWPQWHRGVLGGFFEVGNLMFHISFSTCPRPLRIQQSKGRLALSKLWLKTCFPLLCVLVEFNGLNATRQPRVVQAVAETHAKFQALKATRKNRVVKTLIEAHAKGQALKADRKSRVVETLIEPIAKRQALKTARQSCIVQDLIEMGTKC